MKGSKSHKKINHQNFELLSGERLKF